MRHRAAHPEEPAICVDGDLHIPELVALHGRGGEMLAPVLDPFDREAKLHRSHRDDDFFLIENEFGAETATDRRCDDADAVFRQVQHLDQDALCPVRHLGCRPDGQHIVARVKLRRDAAAFDGVAETLVLVQGLAKNMRGTGKGGVGVAIGQREPGDQIIVETGMCGRRTVIKRGKVIRRYGHVRVIDEPGGVFGNIGGLGDDAGDGFADIADLTICKGRRAGR